MRLTPLDIRHKEFRRGMRGYVDTEVDEFLDEVADEFDRLFKENIELTERLDARDQERSGLAEEQESELASLRQQVAHYRELESTLQRTLLTAQHSADEVAAQAQRDSEELMKQTELKAREVLGEAHADRDRIERSMALLRSQEAEFRGRFRTMLEGYLKQLGALDGGAQSGSAEPGRQQQARQDGLAGGSAAAPATTAAGDAARRPAERASGPVSTPAPAAGRAMPVSQPRASLDTGRESVPAAPLAAARESSPTTPEPGQAASPGPVVRPPEQAAATAPSTSSATGGAPPDERQARSPQPAQTPDAGSAWETAEDAERTLTPEPVAQEPEPGTEDEDTALTIPPAPDDDSFFGGEDGGNTEFKW